MSDDTISRRWTYTSSPSGGFVVRRGCAIKRFDDERRAWLYCAERNRIPFPSTAGLRGPDADALLLTWAERHLSGEKIKSKGERIHSYIFAEMMAGAARAVLRALEETPDISREDLARLLKVEESRKVPRAEVVNYLMERISR